MTDSINWCDLKKNAKHIGEVSTSRVDGSPTGAEILTSTNEVTSQVRDTLAGKLKKFDAQLVDQDNQFDIAVNNWDTKINSQFIYKNGGDWADAPEQIADADKLTYWMFDGAGYAVKGSVTLPITKPASPVNNGDWFVATSVNKTQLDAITDIYNPIFHDGFSQSLSRCRIPAIAIDSDGSVYAFCDQRETYADVPTHVNVGMRKSVDHGVTWSDITIVMNRGASPELGISDPCVVYDNVSDTIYLFAVSVDKTISDPTTNIQMFMSKSTDKGDTWTTPTLIANQDSGYAGMFQGPGSGVCKDGYIYVPVQYWHPVNPGDALSVSGVIRSNDGGLTWESLGHVASPTNENAIAFYGDTLVMTAKSGLNSNFGRPEFYFDFTTMAWSEAYFGQNQPAVQGSLLNVNIPLRYNALIRIDNRLSNSRSREKLTLSVSHNGYNYCDVLNLRDVYGNGYSSMCTDGKYLHILYEDGVGVVYQRLDLMRTLSLATTTNTETLIANNTGIIQTGNLNVQADIKNIEMYVNTNIATINRLGTNQELDIFKFGSKSTQEIAATKSTVGTIFCNREEDGFIYLANLTDLKLIRYNSQWVVKTINAEASQVPTLTIQSGVTNLDLLPVSLYPAANIVNDGSNPIKITTYSKIPWKKPVELRFTGLFRFDNVRVMGWRGSVAFDDGNSCEFYMSDTNVAHVSNETVFAVNSDSELLEYDNGALYVPQNVNQIIFRGFNFTGAITHINRGLRDRSLVVTGYGASVNQKFTSVSDTPSPAGYQKMYNLDGDVTITEGKILTIYPTSATMAVMR